MKTLQEANEELDAELEEYIANGRNLDFDLAPQLSRKPVSYFESGYVESDSERAEVKSHFFLAVGDLIDAV